MYFNASKLSYSENTYIQKFMEYVQEIRKYSLHTYIRESARIREIQTEFLALYCFMPLFFY